MYKYEIYDENGKTVKTGKCDTHSAKVASDLVY